MDIETKYEQWKAITESDFVTLFIKTWFTYIAVLRELNPDVEVFTAEGMPRGDKPFLNAFKDGIMPIVQKQVPVDSVAQELFRMYPISMRKVIDVFPQYFFQTFFTINRSFDYSDRIIDKDPDGKVKERYEAHLHIEDKHFLKINLGISGCYRSTNYNETIKKKIDLSPIIDASVKKHRTQNLVINEFLILRDFYNSVLQEIGDILTHFLVDKLPAKGYNKTVTGKIQAACSRLSTALYVKFDLNYKYPHEVNALDDLNSYAIIIEQPFNGFGRIGQDNIYSMNEGIYSQLIATKGVDWFAGFVYSLRNALFHEIISPLDGEWQAIFKSAYLILKQYSDICIETIDKIMEFPKEQDNAVLVYAESHQDVLFANLANSVELLEFSKMALNKWKIDHGKIILSGWFLANLKLQNGAPEEIEAGAGEITEIEKGFDYEVTLNDDFSLAHDNTGNGIITIALQGE